MKVYLDQNKWIQIARAINGNEKNKCIEKILKLAGEGIFEFPLSGIHYLETSRISNQSRRKKLGKTMWDLSKGQTIASSRDIIMHELEVALLKYFPDLVVSEFNLYGSGVQHAFGLTFDQKIPQYFESIFEEYLLTGEQFDGEEYIKFDDVSQRHVFKEHLRKYKEIKMYVPKEKYQDVIEATVFTDIVEPIYTVFSKHNISVEFFKNIEKTELSKIIHSITLLDIDMHMHKQLLKNEAYIPDDHDLEDWSGLSIGAAYCDVLVCEKHFKDMIGRDGYRIHAKVLTNIDDLLEIKNA